jgi:hypothetical protein
MVGGFVLAFLGMVAITSGLNRGRALSQKTVGRAWASLPKWLSNGLGLLIAVAFVSSVGSMITTDGYSRNPAGTVQGCRWSIGTNHGQTNLCVSHARWLAAGESFERIFVGMTSVFLVIECVVFASVASRSTRRFELFQP